MSYIQEIETDLDWREAELAALRIMMINSNISSREKLVLYRAAWSLLYAHYEGFCKFALTVYYDKISRLGKRCSELPDTIRNFALSSAVKSIRNRPIPEVIDDILSFRSNTLNAAPSFPEVDTRSNLWPSVLEELLECADLRVNEVEENKNRIKTLVSRRNKIAHGEKDIILDLAYYEEYEKAFREIAYNLAIQIETKIETLT